MLTDANGGNRFSTYLYYRKQGNRTSNMVSSIRYGGMKNGQYVIGDGLKYKYDAAGNIAEVFENGISTVRYAYDSLSRLIREDNHTVGKTFLWSYDNNGNILTKMIAGYTVKATDKIETFENIFNYTYDGALLAQTCNLVIKEKAGSLKYCQPSL